MTPPPGYVTVAEAARLMGVDRKTVIKWVESGRLRARRRRRTFSRIFIRVSRNNLHTAAVCTCLWCGRKFKSKRPMLAKYCSLQHKDMYLYAHRKRSRK